MSKIDDILYCQGENTGPGLLLKTSEPFILGKVVLFDSLEQMNYDLVQREPVAYATVPSYRIAIVYYGTLGRGSRIDPSRLEEIKQVMAQMAHYYLEQRILSHTGRFKRYLL